MKFTAILLVVSCLQITLVRGNHRVKRVVGGITAAAPPPDDPVVFVRLYSRDARIEGIRNNRTGIYTFLGIRYAEPPINANRFLRPEYKRMRGDVDATKFGPPCPQPHPDNPNRIIGNEDCLLVNVYSPKMPDESTGLPVIVWIHGGGFRYGSASQYIPGPLIMKNMIVVTIQYRLGVLGILGDGDREFPGNVALFDMAAAVRWVNEYISFFGGNPDNIKIMGHGSGAASAVYLSNSRIPRDSITGVIAMSGSPLTQYSMDDQPKQSVNDVARINNCPTINETAILECMRKKNLNDLVENDSKIQMERLAGERMGRMMTGYVGTAPNVEQPNDGRGLPGFIISDPRDDIKNGQIKRIPLLSGVTKDETSNGIIPKEIESIFKSLDNFLSSLKPLINLNGIADIGNVTTVTQQFTDTLKVPNLSDYLKIPNDLNPNEILLKLVEMTTDIFFNLPMFLMVKQWNYIAPSFLYRFEYKSRSNSASGKTILSGLPLVSKNENKNLIGHGDELGFLFDLADIFGNPVNTSSIKSAEDIKVRDQFTNLIANFAAITNASEAAVGNFLKLPNLMSLANFEQDNSFIRINSEISVESDFRFCQLATFGLPLKSVRRSIHVNYSRQSVRQSINWQNFQVNR